MRQCGDKVTVTKKNSVGSGDDGVSLREKGRGVQGWRGGLRSWRVMGAVNSWRRMSSRGGGLL